MAARSLRTLLAWFALPAICFAGGLASSATTSFAQTQTYPDRPVRLLVPLAAVRALHVVARLMSEKMGDSLGQRFYVENQPGAAGLLGMRAGARAAPDGYTVVVANDSVITMLPNMKAEAGYDPLKDFLPVTQLVGIPLGLIAHPTLPAANVKDLIALARQKPGGINYASGGIGSPQHVATELFVRAAGIEMTHVPYRGATAAVNEIVAGHVPVGFTGMSSVVPLLADKRVRLLATSTSSRASQLPDVPTVAETVPGFSFVPWCALLVPAHTPPEIVARLNTAAGTALKDPAVRARLAELGFDVVGGTPGQLAAVMRAEFTRMGELIRAANMWE